MSSQPHSDASAEDSIVPTSSAISQSFMPSQSVAPELNQLTSVNLAAIDGSTIEDVQISVETLAGGIKQTLTMAHREHGTGYSPSPLPVQKAFQAALRAITKYAPSWVPHFRTLTHADVSAFSIGGGFSRQIKNSWNDHKRFIADFLGSCLEKLQDTALSPTEAAENKKEDLKEISLDPFDDGTIQRKKACASMNEKPR